MRVSIQYWSIVMLFVIGLSACSQPDSEKQHESINSNIQTDGSFDSFKDLFKQTESYSDWPSEIMDPIYEKEAFYLPQKARDEFLKSEYQFINGEFAAYIPIEEVVEQSHSTIKGSTPKFEFWAAKSWTNEQFVLVSILGFSEQKTKDENYSYHPLLLVSYTKTGEILDSFVWTYFAYDMIDEFLDDIDVLGDTLVSGYKGQYEYSSLSEIYTKTIITKEGKFKTVFDQR